MANIAVIIGSISRNSLNRKVANHITQALGEHTISEVRIDDLPLYTQDRDAEQIDSYDRIRAQIAAADAVLIVSPEHNRSMPAAMKNALDIASRPNGANLWVNKKVAIVTASPGSYGGINSGMHLRQSLQALGATVMVAPEVYLSQAHLAFGEDGLVNNERTANFLNRFASSFSAWVNG